VGQGGMTSIQAESEGPVRKRDQVDEGLTASAAGIEGRKCWRATMVEATLEPVLAGRRGNGVVPPTCRLTYARNDISWRTKSAICASVVIDAIEGGQRRSQMRGSRRKPPPTQPPPLRTAGRAEFAATIG